MSSTSDVKSLAEVKKKKVQKPMKNVLTSPYNQYWSPVSKDDLKTLHEKLEKNLPALINLKTRISWKTLQKLSKENRTKRLDEKREKIKAAENNAPLIQVRSYLSIGLNETSRCMSRDELSCLLVDGSPLSKRISVFLVNIALARNIPVLICPRLLEITMGRFGFKSIAVGIKKSVNESPNEARKLLALQDCMLRIFLHQLSTEPILCDRLKRILHEVQSKLDATKSEVELEENNAERMDEDCEVDGAKEADPSDWSIEEEMGEKSPENSVETEVDEDLQTEGPSRTPSENLVVSDSISKNRDDKCENLQTTVPTKKSPLESIVNLPDNIYKYRDDKSYRVFVPKSSDKGGLEVDCSEAGSSDFIFVGNVEPIVGNAEPSQERMFRKRPSEAIESDALFFIDTGDLVKAPVVKKVKPNPKRAARKGKKS